MRRKRGVLESPTLPMRTRASSPFSSPFQSPFSSLFQSPFSSPFSASLLASLLGCAAVVLTGCSSDAEGDPLEAPLPSSTVAGSEQPAPAPTTPPGIAGPGTKPPVDDPGPAPAGCGAITKDKNGFFTRTSGAASYVGFVPTSYTGAPTRLVVGMHGCGDDAMNFATWAVAPAKVRATADYIGISIGGKDGKCWDTNADMAKVTAAIADVSTCFYVHQQKVVLAGYSSGGILAYKLGLSQSSKFAGILVENSGLGGANPAGAAWKLDIAHIAHKGDTSFPIAKTRADWAKLEAAGFPLQKKEVDGDHNGTSDDWVDFLLPKIGAWKAP